MSSWNYFIYRAKISQGKHHIYICCRLKCISGQNDFKLVWFVFPLFYSHYHETETKENTNHTSLKTFWPEIHFNLQHTLLTVAKWKEKYRVFVSQHNLCFTYSQARLTEDTPQSFWLVFDIFSTTFRWFLIASGQSKSKDCEKQKYGHCRKANTVLDNSASPSSDIDWPV